MLLRGLACITFDGSAVGGGISITSMSAFTDGAAGSVNKIFFNERMNMQIQQHYNISSGKQSLIMIRNLANTIIRDGKEPSDWEESFIVCLHKGKGDALDRGNYHGLKLTE